MDRKILLTVLAALITLPVCAGISTDEAVSPEFIKRNGYSTDMVEAIQLHKTGVNGQDYITLDELKYANTPRPIRWVRKFFTYFDPALDDGPIRQHDIKMVPSVNDL